MYLQHYIRVISLVQKGRDYSKQDQRHLDRGSSPGGEWLFAIDVKGGEIVTLM
jgi:hypothetical protein